ncbi:MAG: hypothetical protein OHK0028_07830 [Deltaproteobacteria bacterium]
MTLPTVFKRRRGDGDILVDIKILTREPADVYHAKRDRFLSSHQLAEFRRNPLLYRKKQLGLVQEEDRPAYLIGQAAHALILEGREAYEDRYAFGGPVNPKTGEPYGSRTKAFEEWAAAQGKPVLTHEQMALIENLYAAVCAHEHASALLEDGVPEGVVRTEYCGIPCQARFDWLSPKRGIVDLKTCDNLDWLQADARTYGYAHQTSFYRSLLTSISGVVVPVHLIAAEKREPFRCGVWRMGEEVLGIAQQENEEGIARLKQCRERDHWPTGYEDIRVFDWI